MKYRTKEQINHAALAAAHPFQKQRLELMLADGWNVYAFEGRNRVIVIFASKGSDSQMIAPNGSIAVPFRPAGCSVKKFHWTWTQMDKLCDAPAAPGLLKALGQ